MNPLWLLAIIPAAMAAGTFAALLLYIHVLRPHVLRLIEEQLYEQGVPEPERPLFAAHPDGGELL
jgi:hypothetical protein